MQYVKITATAALLAQLDTLPTESHVGSWFAEYSSSINLHSFCTDKNIRNLNNKIETVPDVRDFILNVVELFWFNYQVVLSGISDSEYPATELNAVIIKYCDSRDAILSSEIDNRIFNAIKTGDIANNKHVFILLCGIIGLQEQLMQKD